MGNQIQWSDEELSILYSKSAEGLKNAEIQKFIPSKTVEHIKRKRIQLGINPRKMWTREEVDLLLEKVRDGYTPKEISEQFLKHRKPCNISWKLSHIGKPYRVETNKSETKACRKCGEIKLRAEFDYESQKTRRVCKSCVYEDHKIYIEGRKDEIDEYMRKYRDENKEHLKDLDRNNYIKNRDDKLKWQKHYYEENKEAQLEWHKQHYRENKDRIQERKNEWRREKLRTDGVMRLRYSFSRRFRQCMTRSKISKEKKSVFKHLNYNLMELRTHLEKQFYGDISWDNYGKEWEVDHRWPTTKFDFKKVTDESFRQCWSLENLQPLDSATNRKKSDRLIYSHIKHLSFFKKYIVGYEDELEQEL